MFDRLKRSAQLVKASAVVLRRDTQLLMFPLISGIASIIVALCFVLPMFGLAAFDGLADNEGVWYSGAFLFYVVQYFIMFYFNAALVGAIMKRMDGGVPTLGDGLRIANSRLGAILGYAIIAATVGMVLRAIQERLGFVGRIIVGLMGVGWTIATFLVVPVLVTRDSGPVESIKESAGLLKHTWGENVIGQAGMSLFFMLVQMGVVLTGMSLLALGLYLMNPLIVALAIVLTIVTVLGLVLIQNALMGIYAAALYRYAANGSASLGFDNRVLAAAFRPKE